MNLLVFCDLSEKWYLHEDVFYLFWSNHSDCETAYNFCKERTANLATVTRNSKVHALFFIPVLVLTWIISFSFPQANFTKLNRLAQKESTFSFNNIIIKNLFWAIEILV